MLTGVYLATKKDKTVYYRSNITHKGRHISSEASPRKFRHIRHTLPPASCYPVQKPSMRHFTGPTSLPLKKLFR